MDDVIFREHYLENLAAGRVGERTENSADTTNSLKAFTALKEKDQAAVERYLYRAIATLVSQEKAYAKHERYQLFNQLDQLNNQIIVLENIDNKPSIVRPQTTDHQDILQANSV